MLQNYAFRDIIDLTFWSKDSNGVWQPQLIFDYLKSAELSGTGETVPLKGGRGNPLITQFHSDREATLQMTSAVISPKMYAMQFGTGVVELEPTKDFMQEIQLETIDNSGVVALKNVADEAENIIVRKTVDGSHPLDAFTVVSVAPTSADEVQIDIDTITDTATLTFHDDVKGKKVLIFFKKKVASGQIVSLHSHKFSNCPYRITGKTFWKDTVTEGCQDNLVPVEFEIFRGELAPDFSIPSAPEGDPISIDITVNVLKPTGSTEMLRITPYKDLV